MKKTSYISSFFLTTLVGFIFLLSAPQPARAIPVIDAPDIAENVISAIENILIYISDKYMEIKESVLDPIAWVVSKTEINLESTKILSGIQGAAGGRNAGDGTLFVHDWINFTDDARNNELAFFNKELFGSTKINPAFKDALSFSFTNVGKPEDLVFKNLQSTFDTDFNAPIGNFYNDFNFGGSNGVSGWDAWRSVNTNPGNNPYLSFLELNDARNIRTKKAEEAVKNEALAGQGFLGTCSPDNQMSSEEDDQVSKAVCDVTRPAVTLGTDLSDVLQQPTKVLGQADELSEIIAAAIGQLTGDIRKSGVSTKRNRQVVDTTEERERTLRESKENAIEEARRAEDRANQAISDMETTWHTKALALRDIDEVEPGLLFSIGRIVDLTTKQPLGQCAHHPDVYEPAQADIYDTLRRKEQLEKEVGVPLYDSEMGTTGDPRNPGPHEHVQPIGTLEPGGEISQKLAASHAEIEFLRKILENPNEIPPDVVDPSLRYAFERTRPDGTPQNEEDLFREARRRTDIAVGKLERILIEIPQPDVAYAEQRRILSEKGARDADWRRCYDHKH